MNIKSNDNIVINGHEVTISDISLELNESCNLTATLSCAIEEGSFISIHTTIIDPMSAAEFDDSKAFAIHFENFEKQIIDDIIKKVSYLRRAEQNELISEFMKTVLEFNIENGNYQICVVIMPEGISVAIMHTQTEAVLETFLSKLKGSNLYEDHEEFIDLNNLNQSVLNFIDKLKKMN